MAELEIPTTHCPVCGEAVGYLPRHPNAANGFPGEPQRVFLAFCTGYFQPHQCEWVAPFLSVWGKE